MAEYPMQVAKLQQAIMNLPGVIECYATPHGLEEVTPEITRLPAQHGDLPQVAIARTDGGEPGEVLLQVEVRFDRSDQAWLSVEFLAWLVRDQARSGEMIQMRPVALPPRTDLIQLGGTLRFMIEHFHMDESGSFARTLEVAESFAGAVHSNFQDYQECFANPVEYEPDDEDGEEGITFDELKSMADDGDPVAQFHVGYAYHHGEGTEEDHQQAVQWYAKAAANGHALAECLLGFCYAQGLGVEPDYDLAMKHLQSSAGNGVGMACGGIGDLYAEGKGLDAEDHTKACEWYEKGYELGEIACLANLGDCYEFGKGVPQDLEKALEIYNQCLEHGFDPVEEAIARVTQQLG